MTMLAQTDILVSLQALHGDVQRRFAELDRYRALKAIERTIADFPGLDDVAHSLGDIRDRVQEQLDGTREFRALRSIERILPELSEVLVLLDGAGEADRNAAPGDPAAGAESLVAESAVSNAAPDSLASDAPAAADRGDGAQVPLATGLIDIEAIALAAEPAPAQDAQAAVAAPAHDPMMDWVADATPDDRHSPGSDAEPPVSETAHVPSLAVSVAQLMAQAAVPPREPPMPSEWSAGTEPPARSQSPAERAA